MGARHAAALALLGCTLVYPPFSAKSHMLDTSLPLEKWYVVSGFDSCAECEQQKLRTLETLESRTTADYEKQLALKRARSLARCVPSNDPR